MKDTSSNLSSCWFFGILGWVFLSLSYKHVQGRSYLDAKLNDSKSSACPFLFVLLKFKVLNPQEKQSKRPSFCYVMTARKDY